MTAGNFSNVTILCLFVTDCSRFLCILYIYVLSLHVLFIQYSPFMYHVLLLYILLLLVFLWVLSPLYCLSSSCLQYYPSVTTYLVYYCFLFIYLLLSYLFIVYSSYAFKVTPHVHCIICCFVAV